MRQSKDWTSAGNLNEHLDSLNGHVHQQEAHNHNAHQSSHGFAHVEKAYIEFG